jgi:site-specific recombinase XerD
MRANSPGRLSRYTEFLEFRYTEILEEVARLIDSPSNLFHRTMLMTLYSTGIQRAELCRLHQRTYSFR